MSIGAVLLLSGCGLPANSVTVRSGGSSPVATATPLADPTPHVANSRLTDPISFGDGGQVFKPPGDVDPVTTKDAAVAAFRRTGLDSNQLADKLPETFLASLTSYDTSDSLGPDGRILPDHVNRLVWVVYFRDIPSAPVGPAHQHPSPVHSEQAVLEDILGIIDATTGTWATGIETTTADPHVLNLNKGPHVNPGGTWSK